MDHMPLCGATTRTGGTCKQPRMKGATRCRIHGGSAPQVRRKAKEVVVQTIIERHTERFSQPRPISAIDALIEELHRTMGGIDWLDAQLRERPLDHDLATPTTTSAATFASSPARSSRPGWTNRSRWSSR